MDAEEEDEEEDEEVIAGGGSWKESSMCDSLGGGLGAISVEGAGVGGRTGGGILCVWLVGELCRWVVVGESRVNCGSFTPNYRRACSRNCSSSDTSEIQCTFLQLSPSQEPL